MLEGKVFSGFNEMVVVRDWIVMFCDMVGYGLDCVLPGIVGVSEILAR